MLKQTFAKANNLKESVIANINLTLIKTDSGYVVAYVLCPDGRSPGRAGIGRLRAPVAQWTTASSHTATDSAASL